MNVISAGDGTIQINQSLAHQSRPASSHVQQSFASAFRRDRSVGPKRTGKPVADKLLCHSDHAVLRSRQVHVQLVPCWQNMCLLCTILAAYLLGSMRFFLLNSVNLSPAGVTVLQVACMHCIPAI